jgi:anaerobic selenocysteine-containing dehydrogenase/Fe-S-cluster-containing dehydrogenase component
MDIKRRDFVKIVGAATVATALPGCTRQQPKNLIPYVIPHEEIIPGKAVWYATVCRECPAGCGIHVRVREGRAVKIEGNPVHPVSDGKVCSRGQASLQGLYNPDRVQYPMRKSEDGRMERITWDDAEELLISKLREIRSDQRGGNVAFLSSHQTGSLDQLVTEFLTTLGSRRRIRYEPFAFESVRKGSETVFGEPRIPQYSFQNAQYIISFGADFLETWMSPIEHARQFGKTRELINHRMTPFVYVGPRLSMTGTNADEFIKVKPGQEYALALGMIYVVANENLSRTISRQEALHIGSLVESYHPAEVSKRTGIPVDKIMKLSRNFASARPGVAVAGGTVLDGNNGALTSAAVHLLNYICGNIGTTVHFGSNNAAETLASYAEILRFTRAMEQGEISALFIYDTNPVFTLPKSSGFTEALGKVGFKVALASYFDETAELADLILPVHTPLESWGDYEPSNGVFGLMQPVMQPVYNTRMAGEILLNLNAQVTDSEGISWYQYVRNRWRILQRQLDPQKDFEQFWVESLANGGQWSDRQQVPVRLTSRLTADSLEDLRERKDSDPADYTLVTYPSLNHYDGRSANRPWLQEIPDPMTQMTWDNWIEIHPEDAKRLQVRNGSRMQVISGYGSIELPAYIYSGVQPGVVAIPIGQGHTRYGRYAENIGANPIELLPAHSVEQSGSVMWSGIQVSLVNKQERMRIANVAGSDIQHGRPFLQVITAEELVRNSRAEADHHDHAQIYPEHDHPDHRWGMTIDLNKCIGCSACVTACYAENNIPIVGKDEIRRGRELSWLQIQRFFDEGIERENGRFLPMLCQHCDNAPCEPVCPVYAAYHTPEGLNAQVYNRCIGTRYCANNCPYKVRRFNWFNYDFPSPLNWQLNPDVTVRTKGVMEKCSFCIQRITEARSTARLEQRPMRDGDVVSACQQACPTDAIVFGDLKDPESAVNKMRERNKPRDYRILDELNTQPAVVYLKDVVELT